MRIIRHFSAVAVACGLLVVVASPTWAQSDLRLTSYDNAGSLPDGQPYVPVPRHVPMASRTAQFPRATTLSTPAMTSPTMFVAPPVSAQAVRPLPSNVQNIIGFYGSQRAAATLQQMPQRPAMMRPATTTAASRQPQRPQEKPFGNASNGTTVSPYMNLYRDDDFDSAPNYYAFVRPQMEQQATNQQQQAELQRLNRQLQRASNSVPAANNGAAVPATGSQRARFGDTAQFYNGFTR